MYAIIETGGKQYPVAQGDRIRVEKLEGDVGSEVELNRVLLLSEDEKVTVGTPTVPNARVMGKIVAQGRHKKLLVFKMKRRKNYSIKQGHRQFYTELEVTGITG